MGWDNEGGDPWKGMGISEQDNNVQPKKENRGWILYHFFIGSMLYAFAKASGVIQFLMSWMGEKGSDPLSATLTASKGTALSTAFLAIGCFASVIVVKKIRSSEAITEKGVILVLFPIAFIFCGLLIAAVLRKLLSNYVAGLI